MSIAIPNSNHYQHVFSCKCPNNGIDIVYRLEIALPADQIVMVEKIVAACAAVETSYHEALADALILELGGQQTLYAHHHGVGITTLRGSL